MLRAEVRPALQFAATMCYLNSPVDFRDRRLTATLRLTSSFRPFSSSPSSSSVAPLLTRAVAADKKPAICTADELHYVPVPGTEWRLAIWRYLPTPMVSFSNLLIFYYLLFTMAALLYLPNYDGFGYICGLNCQAPPRNHPLMLLSGVGTNAIGFDLSPECSFARYMASQGFDTWIVEVRGAGLSTRGEEESMEVEDTINRNLTFRMIQSVEEGVTNGVIPAEPSPDMKISVLPESETALVKGVGQDSSIISDDTQLVMKLTDALMGLTQRLSGFLNEYQLRVMLAKFTDQIYKLIEDAQLSERFNEIREKLAVLLESGQSSAVAAQIRDLSQRIVSIVEERQKSVSPQLFSLPDRLYTTIEDFQKQLDLIVKYNWDFDNYLEEDVPAAMEYVRHQTKPKDGRLLAIGHSMGGILLYAMLSRHACVGGDSKVAAVVTLASSLDYTPSRSSLKLLLPLADPAQALNVPVVPLGSLMAAAYPLACRPPYVLSWLNAQVSAQDMMLPQLFEKLVLNNFCTIPAKLLLQLTTAFREGGLRDRSGTFCYKDHLHKNNVPVLALAGDRDLICPPEAVYETVKLLPQHLATYQLFGQPDGPHYGHYDLVGGRLMVDEVYPCIVDFLSLHDVI